MKLNSMTQQFPKPTEMLEGSAPAGKKPVNKQVMKVAQGFESIFVNQMLEAMRKTVTKGGLIPESNAERTYQAMLDQEYAMAIAQTGELGLAEMVYDHLLRDGASK
jgi:Rod binding domain-containing protein